MWVPTALLIGCLIALDTFYRTDRARESRVAHRDGTKLGSPDQSRRPARPPPIPATTLFWHNPTIQASLKKPGYVAG